MTVLFGMARKSCQSLLVFSRVPGPPSCQYSFNFRTGASQLQPTANSRMTFKPAIQNCKSFHIFKARKKTKIVFHGL